METQYVNYLEQPLTETQLKNLLRAAGLKAAEAIRTKEPAYAKFVAGKNLTDAQLVRLMVEHPELIQRPFVVRGKKAVLARPVDRLSDLDV